jgi:hypothetical protein
MHSKMRVIAVAAVIVGAGLFVAGDADARRGSKAKEAPAWMNAEGEVTDSAAVEAGYGETVTGIGEWEGEVTGKPAPGSKFTQLQIGMPMKQVTDIVGDPTDQGAYVTGKAFIPFYFGSDRHRYELAYKGQGRLIFAGRGWPAASWWSWRRRRCARATAGST